MIGFSIQCPIKRITKEWKFRHWHRMTQIKRNQWHNRWETISKKATDIYIL